MVQELISYNTIILFNHSFLPELPWKFWKRSCTNPVTFIPWAIGVRWLWHPTVLPLLQNSGAALISTKVRQRHEEQDIPTGYRNRKAKYGGIPCSPSARASQQKHIPRWGAQIHGNPSLLPSWQPREAGQERDNMGRGGGKQLGSV